ncbi:MAG: hypothetical protein IJ560_04300 [Alphaproteobacteria bacterium]|nr:hypothetical protein [Alphaproteobacteria bacterium]
MIIKNIKHQIQQRRDKMVFHDNLINLVTAYHTKITRTQNDFVDCKLIEYRINHSDFDLRVRGTYYEDNYYTDESNSYEFVLQNKSMPLLPHMAHELDNNFAVKLYTRMAQLFRGNIQNVTNAR